MTYQVRAVRAGKYWELHIEGEGVTQARNLRQAEAMVRDWLATEYDADFSKAKVVVTPDLGGYEITVAESRKASDDAAKAVQLAAVRQRKVAATLQKRGLSGEDIGKMMGISKGRVSHLTKGKSKKLVSA